MFEFSDERTRDKGYVGAGKRTGTQRTNPAQLTESDQPTPEHILTPQSVHLVCFLHYSIPDCASNKTVHRSCDTRTPSVDHCSRPCT